MPRIFTALEVPPDVGMSLATLRGGLPGARWIDPTDYHMTLRFIGDVDAGLAREVMAMLAGVMRPSFEMKFEGLASFGGRRPRAVVASVAAARQLYELQAELERLMQRVGLDPEGRKYTPHVTLARLRDSTSGQVAEFLSSRQPFRSAAFRVNRFVLLSSKASIGGGPYVLEAAYPLAE